MDLRVIAAGHLAVATAPGGHGEPVTITDPDGTPHPVRGLWSETGSNPSGSIGAGMARTHGTATVRVEVAELPELNPAAKVVRDATGVEWIQERPARLSPGVSWLLFLTIPQPVAARGVR